MATIIEAYEHAQNGGRVFHESDEAEYVYNSLHWINDHAAVIINDKTVDGWELLPAEDENDYVDVVPELEDGCIIYTVFFDGMCMLPDVSAHKDFLGFVWEEDGIERLNNQFIMYRHESDRLLDFIPTTRCKEFQREICKAVRFRKVNSDV